MVWRETGAVRNARPSRGQAAVHPEEGEVGRRREATLKGIRTQPHVSQKNTELILIKHNSSRWLVSLGQSRFSKASFAPSLSIALFEPSQIERPPGCFGCLQESRVFCQSCFRWYNDEHRHSGVGLLTAATVHYGQAENILRQRQDVVDVAYQRHPERLDEALPNQRPFPAKSGLTSRFALRNRCAWRRQMKQR